MKTIIIFLLATVVVFTQTREPEQHTFYFDSNPLLLDTQNEMFKVNDFQLGWHWGSMRKLSKALLMNQADITTHTQWNFFGTNGFNTNTNYFVRAFYDTIVNGNHFFGELYTHCKYDSHMVFTNGITYDPSLYMNPTNPYELNIREGDPQNPVFGFLNKRGRIIDEQFNENYSRLILEDSLTNEVVLSEPWPPSELTFYSYLQHLKI